MKISRELLFQFHETSKLKIDTESAIAKVNVVNTVKIGRRIVRDDKNEQKSTDLGMANTYTYKIIRRIYFFACVRCVVSAGAVARPIHAIHIRTRDSYFIFFFRTRGEFAKKIPIKIEHCPL